MHTLFIIFKSIKVELMGLATMLGLMAVGLDWNQIILAVIGAVAAYIAFLSRTTHRTVEAVAVNLEATKHEMNSQMTKAIQTALEKGLHEGYAKAKAEQVLQDLVRAEGDAAGRLAERDIAKKPPEETKK